MTASSSSCGTPRPRSYMKPRLVYAKACPCSAARRNQRAASSSSRGHPAAVPVHLAEAVLRERVSLLGRPPEPANGFPVVPGHPATVPVQDAEVVLGAGVVLFRRPAVPRHGDLVVARYAATGVVQETEGSLSGGVPLLGRAPEPGHGDTVVLCDAATALVPCPKLRLRPRVSLLGHEAKLRDTEPGDINPRYVRRLYRVDGPRHQDHRQQRNDAQPRKRLVRSHDPSVSPSQALRCGTVRPTGIGAWNRPRSWRRPYEPSRIRPSYISVASAPRIRSHGGSVGGGVAPPPGWWYRGGTGGHAACWRRPTTQRRLHGFTDDADQPTPLCDQILGSKPLARELHVSDYVLATHQCARSRGGVDLDDGDMLLRRFVDRHQSRSVLDVVDLGQLRPELVDDFACRSRVLDLAEEEVG